MTNLYITAIDYIKGNSGQETASLVSNLLRVGSNISIGATALPTNAGLTTVVQQYDTIYIFDGASSEIVTATAGVNTGLSSIPISATQYAHNAGTVICCDGSSGSLGEAITVGSISVESICLQPLFQNTYSETQELRSMAATINSDGALSLRPRQFPVQSISALSLGLDQGTMAAYDATQAFITSNQRRIRVPTLNALGGSGGNNLLGLFCPFNQGTAGFAEYTYVAGFTYANMPWDVKRAAILLTSDTLSDRQNPTGAATLRLGQKQIEGYLRGDTSAQSGLYKRAASFLQKYRRQP
jgi:hypothetical protein